MIRLLALVLLLAPPAAADPLVLPALAAVVGVAPGDVLNVRDAPDADAAVIGQLPPGAPGVEVVAVDASGAWGQVNAGERSGWVALRFLTAEPELWKPGALPPPLACFGTEPFWSLRQAEGAAVLATPEGPDLRLPLTTVRDAGLPGDPRRALVASGDAERLTAFVAPGACSDGMSDRAFGLTAAVLHERGAETRLLTGCCSVAPSAR